MLKLLSFVVLFWLAQFALPTVFSQQVKISRCVERNCGVFLSVSEPKLFVEKVSNAFGLSKQEWKLISEKFSKTDLFDGSVSNSDFKHQTLVSFLSSIKKLYFVIGNSRDQIGEFAFIMDRGETPTITVSKENTKPLISFGCQFIKRFLDQHSPAGRKLQIALSLIESGYCIKHVKNWTIVSSSESYAKSISDGISGKFRKDSLGDFRAFQSSQKNVLDDSFVRCYISTKNLKQILKVLGAENSRRLKEVSWIQYSACFENLKKNFQLKQQTVCRRLAPSKRISEYWDCFRPMDSFPPFGLGDWSRLAAQNMDPQKTMEARELNRIKSKISSDKVTQFLQGENRRNLGFQTIETELPDGSEQTWYKVNEANIEGAKREVQNFIIATDYSYKKAGYKTKLDFTKKDVWRLDILDAISQPELTINSFATGPAYPEGQKIEKKTPPWARKMATIKGNWFVLGNKEFIESTIESKTDSSIALAMNNAMNKFGFENKKPHRLVIMKPNWLHGSASRTIHPILFEFFGFSWQISEPAFQRIMKEGIANARITNSQVVGFLTFHALRKIKDCKLRYLKFELLVERDYFICETFRFEK